MMLGDEFMIYSYSELKKIYKTSYSIRKAINEGKIYKIDNGYYSNKKYVDPMILYTKKYPKCIITLDTAFYYYDLTDVIPQKAYLATKAHSKPIKSEKVVQIYTNDDIFEIGKTSIEIDNQIVNIYDKERLLIELIRKRKQIPFDYYKEIIANYRDIVDELDMYKIETYLPHFKREKDIGNTLLREVF